MIIDWVEFNNGSVRNISSAEGMLENGSTGAYR